MSFVKRCPFCGKTALEFSEGTTYRWMYVGCAECGAMRECRKADTALSAAHDVNTARAVQRWNAERDEGERAIIDEFLDRVREHKGSMPFHYNLQAAIDEVYEERFGETE